MPTIVTKVMLFILIMLFFHILLLSRGKKVLQHTKGLFGFSSLIKIFEDSEQDTFTNLQPFIGQVDFLKFWV